MLFQFWGSSLHSFGRCFSKKHHVPKAFGKWQEFGEKKAWGREKISGLNITVLESSNGMTYIEGWCLWTEIQKA